MKRHPALVETPADTVESSVLERRIADSATASTLAGEIIMRLELRVAELERLTQRMRQELHQLGHTVW